MVIVSVIVPFYNSSRTIKATLNSIIKQSFTDFECIIINDDSNDNSLEIVEKFIAYDPRFKIYNQKKKGVVSARNLGIKKSKGRFITFLDADDLWQKDFLKESITFRNKFNYPIPITHTSYIRFSQRKENINLFEINPPKKINYKNILRKNFLPLLTVMIDREVIQKIEFKELRPEDYKLWIDLIYVKKNESKLIDKKLAFYRLSDYQRSKNKIKSLFRIYNFFLKLPNTSFLKRKLNIFKWIFFNILQRLLTKKMYRRDYIEYIKFLNQ